MWRFEVEGDPVSTNRMYEHGGRGPHLSLSARAWKGAVGWSAREAGLPSDLKGDLELTIHYYHRYPERRLDTDNVSKATIDALQGVAFHNDKQVRRLVVERSHDPERPRLEVTLRLWQECDR